MAQSRMCCACIRLVAVYTSMRHPVVADDVDPESHAVDAVTTQTQAVPSRAKGFRGRSKAPSSRTPAKKLFERLSSASTATSRPASARSASASTSKRQVRATRRPQSAPRARLSPAVSTTASSQKRGNNGRTGGAGGAAGRRRTSDPRELHAGAEDEKKPTARASVHIADLMPDPHESCVSEGGRKDIELAMSVSDFLPRHAPPHAKSEGLRQWCGQLVDLPPASGNMTNPFMSPFLQV
jgi:hypothetical protein